MGVLSCFFRCMSVCMFICMFIRHKIIYISEIFQQKKKLKQNQNKIYIYINILWIFSFKYNKKYWKLQKISRKNISKSENLKEIWESESKSKIWKSRSKIGIKISKKVENRNNNFEEKNQNVRTKFNHFFYISEISFRVLWG